MRIALLILFCSISISASAQWWKLKKVEPRPAELENAQLQLQKNFLPVTVTPHPRIHTHTLLPGDYSLELAEQAAMKTAQHNMRFRIYDVASYNFRDLAQLYVQQNRFSEAKWYFLQSTFLARQQNNNKLTISNLSKLAMVKCEIGDFILAQQDLLEAREIAASHGWLIEIIEVEKKLTQIQRNRFASLRSDMRYAELAAEN
ncbi:hypothetical protein [Mucilaginibacter boryungensis]|uniref:Tetratricopeptide repeat protein n=1 Tax=Mucilaginibacter boryungensis TaxID=768480 RepID=A0ABR9XDH9_9SPHI|nr:hypothetical protein [Mucilaginibacter boryungensis]MBE9665125.1 hypothetical protein [Mucilaginibacter boryungensis]